MAKEKPIPPPPITLLADGPTPEARQANLEAVLPSPGYVDACFFLVETIHRRVELALLDFTKEQVAIRFRIDGVWHELPPKDRTSGDYMLATLKKIADLDHRERRARQEGEFGAKWQLKTYRFHLTSQGVKTGERVVLRIDHPIPRIEKFEQTDIRPKLLERFQHLLKSTNGMVLTSAMPTDGKTAIWRCMLHAADRFLRDFVSFENVAAREPDVINVESVLYDPAKGETPLTYLPKALLRQPDVLCLPDLVSGEVVDEFCEQSIDQQKFILGHVPARSAVEGLLRVLALKADREKFAKTILGVLHQRVLRKLCTNCRQPYQPSNELLLKLGIKPGRVQAFYDEWRPPPPEQQVDAKGNPIEIPICPQCHGVGYLGRTAVYELLVVNDEIRKALVERPSLETLTAAASQGNAPHISLRDEGVVLVAKGITSVQELQRVLSK